MNRARVLFASLIVILVFQVAMAQRLNLGKYRDTGQTKTRVRIASASVVPDKWDKEQNWSRIENRVREAARNGADVVVTPEGVLEGYVINEVNSVKGLDERSQVEQKFLELGEPLDGQYVRKACGLADETGVFLVLGFLERSGNQLYNTAILIDPDGDIVGRYSKTHFAQGYAVNPEFYDPGEEYPVFETPFGKVGMLICYDRQLPEPARILALEGAQVLFVPSYGSYTDENGWNTILMRTRAYENGFPVVFSHPFQSLLINRNGSLLAVGSANEVVYYEINTAPEHYQERFSNRRPETYGKIVE